MRPESHRVAKHVYALDLLIRRQVPGPSVGQHQRRPSVAWQLLRQPERQLFDTSHVWGEGARHEQYSVSGAHRSSRASSPLA